MSIDRTVYVGVYLKVWMPKEKYTDSWSRTCPQCKNKTSHKYCPLCGTRTTESESERMADIGNLFHEVFGNYDQFSRTPDATDHVVVIANLGSQSGHVFVEEDMFYDIPAFEFDGDWVTLEEVLKAKGVRSERHFGIVNFER